MNVEKGVPVLARSKRKAPGKFACLADMDIGDSFVFAMEDKPRLAQAIYRITSVSEKDFTYRKLEDGTMRCWRIE